MADEIDLNQVAADPAEVEVDGTRVKAQPLADQIAAKKDADRRAFTGSAWGACTGARVVPPGTTGPSERE